MYTQEFPTCCFLGEAVVHIQRLPIQHCVDHLLPSLRADAQLNLTTWGFPSDLASDNKA